MKFNGLYRRQVPILDFYVPRKGWPLPASPSSHGAPMKELQCHLLDSHTLYHPGTHWEADGTGKGIMKES